MTAADPEDTSVPSPGEGTDDGAVDGTDDVVAMPPDFDATGHDTPVRDVERGEDEDAEEEEEEPGDRWHVVEVGAGRPVVFVPDVFAPADCFDAVIDDLADDWRCAVVDLPGHGESTPLHEGRPFDEVAEELADVLVELQTAPASFVGHGVGATLVLALARRRPELVTSMVLVSADPGGVPAPLVQLVPPAPTDSTAPEVEARQVDLVEDWLPNLCAARFYNEQPGRAQDLRNHLAAFDAEAAGALARAVVDGGAAVVATSGVPEVPVAVIGGADDAVTSPEATRRFATVFGVDADVVPVAGRMLPVERPQALAASLRRHLDRV